MRSRGKLLKLQTLTKMGEIKILQANLQHAIDAASVLVASMKRDKINIALIQEPYIGNDGRVRGLSGFGGNIFSAEVLPQFLTRDLVAITTMVQGIRTVVASAYFPHAEESPHQMLSDWQNSAR